MCPTLASTSKSGPRYSAIVRALRGDSTMTSRLPVAALLVATGSPFLTLTRRWWASLILRSTLDRACPPTYFFTSASRPRGGMTRPSTVARYGSSSWVSHLCGESDTVSDEAPAPWVKDQDRPGVCTITSRSGMMVPGVTRCDPLSGVMTGALRRFHPDLRIIRVSYGQVH